MRRLSAILFLLMSGIVTLSWAQNTTGLSEEEMIRYYGTAEEYIYGYKLVTSSPPQPMVFAGHVVSWVTLAAGYLEAHCGCSIHDSRGQLISHSYTGTLYIQAHCPGQDVELRIAKRGNSSAAIVDSINISGNAEALTCLFLGYWQNSSIAKSRLKKGALETQYYITDRITYNWKGKAPVITIERNPDYKGD